MTEIPDHLLQRSRSRRQALGQEVAGGEASDAAGAPAAAPAGGGGAVVATGAVLPKGPAVPAGGKTAPVKAAPVVVPHYIDAHKKRSRIPVWAMPALLGLPLWGVIYAGTLTPAPSNRLTTIAEGSIVYNVTAGCAGCHGGDGAGAVGPKLNEGAVSATFAGPLDQIRWIVGGSKSAVGGVYGDKGKTSKGGMPAFGKTLTPLEIVSVVRHERETLSGSGPAKRTFANDLDGWKKLPELSNDFPSLFTKDEVEKLLEELEAETKLSLREGEAAKG